MAFLCPSAEILFFATPLRFARYNKGEENNQSFKKRGKLPFSKWRVSNSFGVGTEIKSRGGKIANLRAFICWVTQSHPFLKSSNENWFFYPTLVHLFPEFPLVVLKILNTAVFPIPLGRKKSKYYYGVSTAMLVCDETCCENETISMGGGDRARNLHIFMLRYRTWKITRSDSENDAVARKSLSPIIIYENTIKFFFVWNQTHSFIFHF